MTKWAALLLLSACIADEERTVVEVGVVDPDAFAVQYPARVAAGDAATIIVVSYGDGCTTFDSTDVEQTANSVDITPYDSHALGVCDDAAFSIEHPVAVTFDAPGTKTLRVHAWTFSLTDRARDTEPVPVDYEYTIVVD